MVSTDRLHQNKQQSLNPGREDHLVRNAYIASFYSLLFTNDYSNINRKDTLDTYMWFNVLLVNAFTNILLNYYCPCFKLET